VDDVDTFLAMLVDEPEDELAHLLVELRWLVLKHPIAARAIVRALREEGRRFAATPDGKAWSVRLAGSELIRRGQLVWNVGTAGALDHDDNRMLPSELVDAFARASARRDLESAISIRTEPRDNSES